MLKGITVGVITIYFIGSAFGIEARGKLEYFDYKELKIVAAQKISGKWRACVYTPNSEAVIVSSGDGIGLDKAVIADVQKDGLRIREFELRDDDWVERRTFLKMSKPIDAKVSEACKLKIDRLRKSTQSSSEQ